MRVGDAPTADFHQGIAHGALSVRVGPFSVQVRSDVAQIPDLMHTLYADYPVFDSCEFVDYRISVRRPHNLRRWFRPYAEFSGDGDRPFSPLPVDMAFPLLEWGLNWCVATTAHQFLMLHAGVVERGGVTILFPALPGSGKSTLCAGLMNRGWRLLSDEFGLVRPGDVAFTPFPRCIPLKNESIDVIRKFAPDAVLGPIFYGTRKGDVAHLKPTPNSIARADDTARVTHVVFPQFAPEAPVAFTPIPKARAFMKLSSNSFNYEIFGKEGFHTIGDIIERSECLAVEYGDLEEAVTAFGRLG